MALLWVYMDGSSFHNCWLPASPEGEANSPREAAELELKALGIPYDITVTGDGDNFTLRGTGSRYSISGGGTGVLYGAFRLISLLKTGEATSTVKATATGKATPPPHLTEPPSFTHRIINHWDNVNGNVERGYSGKSFFFENGEVKYDERRVRHYARMLASLGINAVAVNNVNVTVPAMKLITEEQLPKLAGLAAIFRPHGIRLIISVSFASPVALGGLKSADPLNSETAAWWARRMNLVYSYIPDLLGVLVKADSESQHGPFHYGRSHADGANMLAGALAPHGGFVYWRCFVYNCQQDWRDADTDRPMYPYENFMLLDGRFDDNVVLQIKNGPYDFQRREPVSPLLGAMKKTVQAVELQIAQEYTGQQIDLCFLPSLWREVLDEGFKVRHIAGVANTGGDYNWFGSYLAGANLYGYGRLAWDSSLTPQAVAAEWCGLMFENEEARAAVKEMLLSSRGIYESYTTPMSMGWFVKPGTHYGSDPLGYEFSEWGTYHRADADAVGIDRSRRGTGFVKQYPEKLAAVYDDINTCPEELLLFFHRVPYGYVLKNGTTLLQYLYDCHFRGAEGAEGLLNGWKGIKGKVPDEIYENVLERLNLQRENAFEWRDVFNTFFRRLTGEGDRFGRLIYD